VTSSSGDIRLTTAQALVRFLTAQHTDRDGQQHRLVQGMFGIFGHGNVTGLGQALEQHAADMPYYQARNEQSMVHTALAFARRRRRLTTFACTSSIGPGATNMLTGAATATINRLPVLLIPGDIYASRRQGNVLQQLEHPIDRDVSVNDCFRPVSRYFDRVSRPEQLVASLPEAMRVLTDPAETGAVTLALPQDVGTEESLFPARLFQPRVWRIDRRPPASEAIADAVTLLAGARRPLLIAGGGVHHSDASAEVEELARMFGVPVAETFAGKGAVSAADAHLVGGIGVEGTRAANYLAANADVVICVGTRLGDFVTGSRSLFQHPDVRFVTVNVTPHDAAKLGALPIVADAREGLRAILEKGRAAGLAPSSLYLDEVADAVRQWRETVDTHFTDLDVALPTQGQIIRTINEEARPGDTIVAASGAAPGDLLKIWDATESRRCQIEFGNSCMGHELPGAIGVRLAQPDGEVIGYVGDGAYLLGPAELLTAAQEGLKITVVIVNNSGFQVIRRLQLAQLGRSFGNELRHRDLEANALVGPYVEVDLASNARSLGARVWQVRSVADFRQALRESRKETRACAVVVDVEKDVYLPSSGAWWDVAPPSVSDDPDIVRRRQDYEQARESQRFYG
jgi:3D-(3,5/4)-trihydroxycyclohexane-1,2-dione acylhydrolase (decyclizing)